MRPRAYEWVAIILAIGATGAVVALAIAAAIAEASNHLNLSEAATSLLSTALGALIGAVATYLGVTRTGGVTDDTSDE